MGLSRFALKVTNNNLALPAGATVGAAFTVKVRVWLPVPPVLLAEIVTVLVPAAVGVPEIRPVPVLTERPAGKPVALKAVGELLVTGLAFLGH